MRSHLTRRLGGGNETQHPLISEYKIQIENRELNII